MLTIIALTLLAQSQPAVRRSTPASDDPGMVVRQTGTVSVNCTNCGNVYLPDGGNIGSVQQGLGLDGGTGWGVYIEGGNLSVTAGISFDGGSIGYLQMPDAGPLEVYVVNSSSSGGGWVPDGGFIGSVQVLFDGGYVGEVQVTNVLSVVVLDGGGSSTVTQGPSWDGGADWAVLANGKVDTGNSTTTPLGGGAAFTGSWVEVLNYSVITVTAYSDVASATDGWKVQWSSDGSNVDAQESLTLNAGSGRALALNTRSRYFRVVYTNGGAAQATFRLGTTLHQSGTGINNYPLNKSLYQTSMSILTRSVITGETSGGGGGFVNVKVTPSGALVSEVTQSSFPWLVAGADGGALPVTQSFGQDGGAWNVSVNNFPATWYPDGGYVGVMTALGDGGVTAYQGGTWNVGVTGSVAVTGPLTDAQLRATPVPVSGTVTANAGSGPWPVTDNGGSLTVDGTVAATQSGTWSTRAQDGVGNALASSTSAPAGTEQALIVRNIPSGTQTISGTVTANAGSGPFPVSDNGGSLTVDGTVAATQSGTWNVTNISGTVSLPTGAATETTLGTRLADSTFTGRFAAPASLADATANPSVTDIGSYLMGYNGTTWDRLRKSASGLLVDIQNTSLAVTQSGTWNVGLSSGTNYVGKFRQTDGTLDLSLLNSAPGSDTGQVSVPVRIISSLAGGSGGTSSSFGAAVPATGTAVGFKDGASAMRSARVFDTDTGAGQEDTLGVTLRVAASGGSAAASTGSGVYDANTLRVVLPTNQPAIGVTPTGTVTVDTVELPASTTLNTDGLVDPDTTSVGTYLYGFNGTSWDRIRASISTGVLVNVSNTTLAATQSGTWNVGLNAGTNYVGKFRQTDGTLDLSLLNSAPGSDTGQVSIPVRVISSLAGGAGGTSSSYGAAFPASGTAAGFSDGTNMASARVFDADTGGGTQNVLGVVLRNAASGGSAALSSGSGTVDANTLRVVLPTNQPAVTVSGSVSVSGTVDVGTVTTITDPVTVTGSVVADTELAAPTTLASDSVSTLTSTSTIGSYLYGFNGLSWDRLRSTISGGLLVNVSNTNLATTSTLNAALPSTGTVAGFSDGSNIQAARVFDLDTGAGAQWSQGVNLRIAASGGSVPAATGPGVGGSDTLRVILPTDQTAIPITDNSGSITVDGTVAATQSGTWNLTNISGTISLPTGAATETTLGTRLAESTFTGRFAAGALLSDNFANPTTTGVGAFGMLWDGATWDRTPGNSTDGVLVNLGANNDVTVTSGTVTANAGTGTFTVGQATASNLRAQTSAESAAASAVPANAMAVGYKDTSGNLQQPVAVDADTSGATQWVAGSVLLTGNSGGGAQVTGRGTSDGYNGLSVHMLYKATSTITNTAVTCTGTATAMPGSVQSNRSTLTVYNAGTQTVYIGNATVTTANGMPLPPGAYWADDVRVGAYYCIVASGTADVRVMEQ